MSHFYNCLQCEIQIEGAVYNYSNKHFNKPLCRDCQVWYVNLVNSTTVTDQAIALYFGLKEIGINALIEESDGYKTVDLTIPDARVNIEVDGLHHIFKPTQALSDLKRTYYSFRKGFLTLRVPNALIENNIKEACELIADFIQECNERYNGKALTGQTKGYCIRCNDNLPFNPDKPFCYSCFSIWNQWENYRYEENFCHVCGNENTSSMSKPLCLQCYKKYKY